MRNPFNEKAEQKNKNALLTLIEPTQSSLIEIDRCKSNSVASQAEGINPQHSPQFLYHRDPFVGLEQIEHAG